jgi:hypothetical protein
LHQSANADVYVTHVLVHRRVVLTTMNGDEVLATCTGILSSDGVITSTYVIHGGTGRTVNATGSGTVNGFEAIDLATGAGTGQIRLVGTLSY